MEEALRESWWQHEAYTGGDGGYYGRHEGHSGHFEREAPQGTSSFVIVADIMRREALWGDSPRRDSSRDNDYQGGQYPGVLDHGYQRRNVSTAVSGYWTHDENGNSTNFYANLGDLYSCGSHSYPTLQDSTDYNIYTEGNALYDPHVGHGDHNIEPPPLSEGESSLHGNYPYGYGNYGQLQNNNEDTESKSD